jgi:hypothetical protein
MIYLLVGGAYNGTKSWLYNYGTFWGGVKHWRSGKRSTTLTLLLLLVKIVKIAKVLEGSG